MHPHLTGNKVEAAGSRILAQARETVRSRAEIPRAGGFSGGSNVSSDDYICPYGRKVPRGYIEPDASHKPTARTIRQTLE
ncbi:hypothetical protein PGT21_034428 [Puccinia graminis f. sp. tritici]|uniref:Uncharacterized protein n=1 Tax=Puccinia graminis f. sp. tritici TaxID=56615 RepID=A0A5B0M9G2_PUCGR|nr:hypothetical protein PGT21_034428 [Puccinia graminis f. sp. tritici]